MSENVAFEIFIKDNYFMKNIKKNGFIIKTIHPQKGQRPINNIFDNQQSAINHVLENKSVNEIGIFSIGEIKIFDESFVVSFPDINTYFIGNLLKKEEVYSTINTQYHNDIKKLRTKMFVKTKIGSIHPLNETATVFDPDTNKKIWPLEKISLYQKIMGKIKEFSK